MDRRGRWIRKVRQALPGNHVNNPLLTAVEQILTAEPQTTWSEHGLIRRLLQAGQLTADYATDSLALFHTHFLVMNALYQLRRRLVAEGRGGVEISALRIALIPAADVAAQESRSLAAGDHEVEGYYLDWANFASASTASVDELLSSFWRRYLVQDDRHQALQLLELAEPVTLRDIKQRYREKAMLWHPDRGGSDTQLAELNGALEVLKRYYGA